MDGLEWKRSKYSNSVKAFLKFAEKLAVNNSDELIADSKAIQSYIKEKHHKDSVYIPYGANVFDKANEKVLKNFSVQPFQYDLLIARLEPENNIEQILDGFSMTKVKRSFLVIGNKNTTLAKKIKKKHKHDARIKFLGYVKDIEVLNSLRYFSNLYFHGHSVGGTNPSLLEAMSSNALICAHNNVFNRAILGQDAIYFKTKFEVSKIVASSVKDVDDRRLFLNTQKITQQYSWDQIISDYEDFLLKSLKKA
jgi:glycosyltransferase involved in cell wall biosynthesis